MATSEAAGRSCEDALLVRPLPGGMLLAIADGARGMSGGRRAAEMTLELLAERVIHPMDGETLRELLHEIDRRLLDDSDAGETTLVACIASSGRLQGASVGDSGAWLFETELIDLTRRQERKPLLGSGRASPTSFGPIDFAGTLLLATDGLLKYAPRDRIAALLKDPLLDVIAAALIDLVRLRSGHLHDDTTVLLARPTHVRSSGQQFRC